MTFRSTSSVAIDDEAYLKAWLSENGYKGCLKYRDPEISKAELGRLLKEDIEIPGCRIESGESMQVK